MLSTEKKKKSNDFKRQRQTNKQKYRDYLNYATQMDTFQHCVSVLATLGRESEANTPPCVTENSSRVLSAP